MIVDLRRHGRRYAFEYPPHGHSDHLPMALLALAGLGAPAERRESFVASYQPRLTPAPPGHAHRQQALLDDIDVRGITAVVEDHLPRYVSGWYRAAYHPLIRLAYGVAFDQPGEVAAGLAYLEACGASARLEALARRAVHVAGPSGLDLLRLASGWRVDPGGDTSFDARADAVLVQPRMAELAVTVNDNLRETSRAALAAFASTHDFFALHLVTAGHAFRILHRFAGPDADAVMNLGLLAGFLAIGAPDVAEPSARAGPTGLPAPARLLELCRDDEHDLKVAYSAWAQAAHWQDPAYLVAVEEYLRRR
jgi:hypothetical protein